MEESIIEGNKLIAEFMGGKVKDDLTCEGYNKLKIPDWAFVLYNFDTLKIGGYCYHLSFDWLTPVVKKFTELPIEQFNYDVENMGRLRAFKNALIEISITAPIHKVYNYMVEICEWYNQNK